MSEPTLNERLGEILIKKNLSSNTINEVNRDTLDDVCDELGINILEKAYVVGLDPRLIFSEGFIKGITFLQLNRNEDNYAIWKNILNISNLSK